MEKSPGDKGQGVILKCLPHPGDEGQDDQALQVTDNYSRQLTALAFDPVFFPAQEDDSDQPVNHPGDKNDQ